METVITFTPLQLYQGILGICAAITAVAAAIVVIASLVKKVKAPNDFQNNKLAEHDKQLKQHEDWFANDDKRLKNIEDGNKITQKALLALLSHGIDGNDVDSMKRAKEELQHFLIEK